MSTVSLSSSFTNGGWVVQKFGGTSVGKFPEKIADDIVKVYSQTNRVAVVCSARSSKTKSEGTTSRLLRAADLASIDGDYESILEIVRKDHVENAESKIKDCNLLEKLIKDTNFECDQVLKLLHASQIIGEISPKTLDSIMSAGEKLSCLFMAALFNDHGIKAQYIDLSTVIAPGLDISRSGFDNSFYSELTRLLSEKVQEIQDLNIVPVLTGYFGIVPGGLLNGVGRGYTDLCAALIAVGINADELQVWKEVDGIFTADPRKVPNARLLQSVTPEEAAELTYYGSEVIHPFTMEQVIKAKIPIRIKNVENPIGEGTIIYPDDVSRKGEETPPHPPISVQKVPSSVFTKARKATAITTKHDIIVLNVHSNKKTLSHGFLAHIFSTLDRYKLVVDLISTSEVHVSMALQHSDDENASRDLKEAVNELRKLGTVDVTKKMAIVSLVGKHMKQFIGVASTMFSTLAEQNINIEMISQGANEINISAVIDEKNAIKALQSIHQKLLESPIGNVPILNERISQLKVSE
ncbi:aspartate kinase [Wickerhamomyces ciferrii]|uniref:Aspartokinase n=1 Tax=Wickerhamomyces ciferrii (strain ATCC 14091 / BCRC 22168 / CBS 111 / JCM 3599 / NBRC 0793 / NRRL Y-1031 F-60-10) TaxID=1206466 RepID=K0K9I5_WICCF|nr:aspartate kinase [Wickerhamomyces ciferrii]CCH41575.1 aspartate kinase [Wickerhamomyces ciferrii]